MRQRASHPHNRGLRRHIHRNIRRRNHPRNRSHVDDRPSPRSTHRRSNSLHHEELLLQVDSHRPIPRLRRNRLHRMPRIISSIIHQHIHRTKPPHNLLRCLLQRRNIRQVASAIRRRSKPLISQPRSQTLRSSILNIQEHHASLLPHKRLHNSFSNPTRTACHNHHAIFQTRIHRSFALDIHPSIITRERASSLHHAMH